MLDTSVRAELLPLLASTEHIVYEGVVVDLLGRPAVAFSGPFATVDVEDLQGVRSYILFPPEDGQPVGWEYHDPQSTRIEWRAEAFTAFEIVEFDPASVAELPTPPSDTSHEEQTSGNRAPAETPSEPAAER